MKFEFVFYWFVVVISIIISYINNKFLYVILIISLFMSLSLAIKFKFELQKYKYLKTCDDEIIRLANELIEDLEKEIFKLENEQPRKTTLRKNKKRKNRRN